MTVQFCRRSRRIPFFSANQKPFIVCLLSVLLPVTATTAFQQTKVGRKVDRQRSASVAPAGIYIELSRCNACSGPKWQQRTIGAFRLHGFSAFAGSAKYDQSYQSIEFLEKLLRFTDKLTPVYVGPFDTERTARSAVSQIPSILKDQIREDQSPQDAEPTGHFEVRTVRVRSSVARGGIDGLPAEAYVIRQGVGIGRVLVGSRKSDVEAVLGKPFYSTKTLDTWQSGTDSLVVYYRNGRAHQIEVSSPKFRTPGGLSVTTSSHRFTQMFPGAVKRCCGIYGASGFSEWTCWDAVKSGIALRQGSHSGGTSLNAIIVHSPGTSASQSESEDADCKPCR